MNCDRRPESRFRIRLRRLRVRCTRSLIELAVVLSEDASCQPESPF
jgi:hypothetical protein